MAKSKTVVVGSSNTDMVIRLPRVPRPGETLLGDRFVVAAGGKGANQAVAAARAGGDVTFVARVGRDSLGQQAVAGFVRDGIHVQHVFEDDSAPSGVALIFVGEDGQNSIAIAPGANGNLSPNDIEQARESITTARLVILQLETPIETVQAAAAMAAQAGVQVILNPAPARPLSDTLLQHVSILTPNETEAELLTGIPVIDDESAAAAADRLLGRGVKLVIVTLGSRGVLAAQTGWRKRIPAFAVSAVDTTAAGDVFNGALGVALVEGLALETAIRFASAAAAISVTRLGAQPSIPTRTEIETFLAGQCSRA